MKLLSFGECSLYLIFPLLVPIFNCLRGLIHSQFSFNSSNNTHPFFISFLSLISNALLGIPYFLFKKFNKPKSNIQHKRLNFHFQTVFLMDHIKEIEDTNEKKKIIAYIILISLIVSCALPTFSIFNYSEDNPLILFKSTIILIFFICFFSKIFLSTPLYRHHYLSLGVILIAVALCCYNDFASLTWQILLSCLIANLLISLAYVGEKYLMEFKSINPYELVFYIGCCGLCIYIVVFIILYFIPCTPKMLFCKSTTGDESVEDIILLLQTMSAKDYGYSLLYIILFGIYLLFCYLTNYYLSPIHYCISEIITIVLFWIIDLANEKYDELWYLSVIGYILMLFSACVCNEWIIIRIWSLDLYTRIEIQKRSVSEINEEFSSLELIEAGVSEHNMIIEQSAN